MSGREGGACPGGRDGHRDPRRRPAARPPGRAMRRCRRWSDAVDGRRGRAPTRGRSGAVGGDAVVGPSVAGRWTGAGAERAVGACGREPAPCDAAAGVTEPAAPGSGCRGRCAADGGGSALAEPTSRRARGASPRSARSRHDRAGSAGGPATRLPTNGAAANPPGPAGPGSRRDRGVGRRRRWPSAAPSSGAAALDGAGERRDPRPAVPGRLVVGALSQRRADGPARRWSRGRRSDRAGRRGPSRTGASRRASCRRRWRRGARCDSARRLRGAARRLPASEREDLDVACGGRAVDQRRGRRRPRIGAGQRSRGRRRRQRPAARPTAAGSARRPASAARRPRCGSRPTPRRQAGPRTVAAPGSDAGARSSAARRCTGGRRATRSTSATRTAWTGAATRPAGASGVTSCPSWPDDRRQRLRARDVLEERPGRGDERRLAGRALDRRQGRPGARRRRGSRQGGRRRRRVTRRLGSWFCLGRRRL